jgi:hypothetical protein
VSISTLSGTRFHLQVLAGNEIRFTLAPYATMTPALQLTAAAVGLYAVNAVFILRWAHLVHPC